MREDLGGHTDGNAFGSLGKQKREPDRKFCRLLVAAVIRGHPVGDLRVEDHFLGELRQARLDVPRGGVAVSSENITPVTLAVDQKAFLAELDKGSEDGSVSVRMVLHGLADYIGHLCVASVVHPVHGVQHAPLHGLQSVNDVRYGPLEDDIGGIVQEPVLEHPGKLVFVAVRAEQLVVLAG